MKGFKIYSIIGIGLSIVTFALSFFMVDLLPMLYKLYTGNAIDPSKMTKLLEFGSGIINDLKIYSIFGLLSFITIYFLKNIKQYFVFLVIALLIHFVFIAEIGEFTVFRRLYQLVVMLPLLWMFFEYFTFKDKSYYQKITHGFLYISLLCIVLPGAYFPPFFNGIAGWTAQIDKTQPVSVRGVFLVRDDGAEVIYSRSIVNPINFTSRVNGYVRKNYPDKVDELLTFYETVYKKRYDILKKRNTPNQQILGKLAYPGHNPYGKFDYSKFPPSSINEIKISTKYYTWDKKFIEEKVVARKDWK